MKNVTKSTATSIAISTTPPSNTPLQAPVERYCFITAGSSSFFSCFRSGCVGSEWFIAIVLAFTYPTLYVPLPLADSSK